MSWLLCDSFHMLQYDSFVSHIVCAVYWLENAQILDPEATKLDPNAIKVTSKCLKLCTVGRDKTVTNL